MLYYIIETPELMQCPLSFRTGSVTGLLGESASSFYVPPPESRPRDPVDRILALRQVPSRSGWIEAPTEVPLFVPSVAPSRQAPAGPLPSVPAVESGKGSRKRTSVGGFLRFERKLRKY